MVWKYFYIVCVVSHQREGAQNDTKTEKEYTVKTIERDTTKNIYVYAYSLLTETGKALPVAAVIGG